MEPRGGAGPVEYERCRRALVCDGRIAAAAEEERFVRQKHVTALPVEAIRYCLREGGWRFVMSRPSSCHGSTGRSAGVFDSP